MQCIRYAIVQAKLSGLAEVHDAASCRWNTAIREIVVNVWSKRRINRAAQLWWQGKNTDVVVQHIVGHGEAGPNGGTPARPRRIRQANTRSPVVLGGSRLAEINKPRNAGQLVQGLGAFAYWNSRVFIPNAQ